MVFAIQSRREAACSTIHRMAQKGIRVSGTLNIGVPHTLTFKGEGLCPARRSTHLFCKHDPDRGPFFIFLRFDAHDISAQPQRAV